MTMENLYIIKCNEFYKIGVANDLESRLASLQTGNPYPLVVLACFEFPNAGIVERALHQAFASVRSRGEWFALGGADLESLLTLCRGLGGHNVHVQSELVPEQEIEAAEAIQETVLDNPDKWDYAAMFADGWRMDKQDSRGIYWNWRKGFNENRQTIYGGAVAKLPYPIEEMRRIYRDGDRP
jgi:hypothetical protein